jgi:hypothetical protein
MKKIVLMSLGILGLAACGPKIYKSQSFDGALTKHKTVAILPAEVSIQLRPNEAKRMTPEQLSETAQKTGYDIQDKMQGWFLRRSDKFHYTVTFQDVNRTNARLKEAGIKYTDLKEKDRADLAKVLGVDAVIQNRVKMEKPISEGVAIAAGLLLNTWGPTNNVLTTININDGKSGDVLWKYDYAASGTIGSSTERLVDALMRNASRKFPYRAGK